MTSVPDTPRVLFGRLRGWRLLVTLALPVLISLATVSTVGVGTAQALPGPPGVPVGLAEGDLPRGEWPLTPHSEVLRGFDPPEVPWGAGHRGVDLAASVGQSVHTAADGVIGFVGLIANRGVVTVLHDSLRTTYEPVVGSVAVGEQVRRGEVIGHLEGGTGHCASQPCLHWGLLRGDEYLDPLALLRRAAPRLLPHWEVNVPSDTLAPAGSAGFSAHDHQEATWAPAQTSGMAGILGAVSSALRSTSTTTGSLGCQYC